jgi:hypothetical protein
MKHAYTLLYFCLIASIGISQKNTELSIELARMQLDLDELPHLKADEPITYYLADSTKIELADYGREYQQRIKPYKSKFETVKNFNKKNKFVMYQGNYFERMPIGIHKHYNLHGEEIRRVNEDSLYPISIYNIAEIMEKEYGKNMMDVNENISANRYCHDHPYYQVSWYLGDGPESTMRILMIDGKTGRVKDDVEENYECGSTK